MTPSRLGIIGGAGPFASALLYRRIVEELYKEKRDVPEFLIHNFLFTRIHSCTTKEEFDLRVQQELQHCIHTLLVAGVNVAAIVCNTFHAYLPQLQGDLRFIHLPRAVVKRIIRTRVSKVLLLSTKVTKNAKLYEDSQYDLITLSPEEQQCVDEIIANILHGYLLKEDSDRLMEIIAKAEDKESIEGVILGCTELPVLNAAHPLRTSSILFDSIDILANHITSEIL